MPKKTKVKTKKAAEKTALARFFEKLAAAAKKSSKTLFIMLATFALVVVVTLLDYATREKASYIRYADYEVGQVADVTIVAKQARVSPDGVSVKAGEKIIRKGFLISEDDYKKLQLVSYTPEKLNFREFWHSVLYLVLLLLVTLLLMTAGLQERALELRETIFLCAVFFIVYCSSALLVNLPVFASPYALVAVLPAALGVMLISILLDLRIANCFALILSLGVFSSTSYQFVPFLFVLVSCLLAARLVCKMEKRMDFIYVSLGLALVNAALLFVLSLLFRGEGYSRWACYAGVAFNGFISGVLALGFLTPLEVFLNTVTTFRLMDLSDLNSSIMKHMLLNAPGTYNHSMLVATLAENACREIGANSLLARVGAYYHDLGKLENPEYFTENQSGGNKHDELNPTLSVSIIKRHVRKGVEKAQQLHLPQEVIDIIAEHHGNSVIEYFYFEAKKNDPNVSPDDFSYLGTPPSSKEAAVVMLADTVEAASRAKNAKAEKLAVPNLEKLIRDLVMHKYEGRQLDKSNLTFKELDKIQAVFVNILAGYYHSRIDYPSQKEGDDSPAAEKEGAAEKKGEGKEKDNEK